MRKLKNRADERNLESGRRQKGGCTWVRGEPIVGLPDLERERRKKVTGRPVRCEFQINIEKFF